jgi:DNA-binding MarR family transcriptional regulator
MLKEILLNANLTPSQAEILEYLYQNKEDKASIIAKQIKRSRAIVYKEIEELTKLKIIEKREHPVQAATFVATHPSSLEKLFDNREQKFKREKENFFAGLPNIVSSYNLNHNRPGIKFYEGIDGLKKIYDEVLEAGLDFHMIRSANEPIYQKEIFPVINEFIKKRVKKNMKVTAIIPKDFDNNMEEKTNEWLLNIFWVDKKIYNSPVEIIIFGNKIAILSFSEELIGIVIESKQIAISLVQIFSLASLGCKKINLA